MTSKTEQSIMLFIFAAVMPGIAQPQNLAPAQVPELAAIRKMTYQSPRNPALAVGVQKIQNLNYVQVLNSPGEKPKLIGLGDHPALSPNGEHILFCEVAGLGYDQLQIINADGSDRKSFTNLKHHGFCFPQWSPDGTEVALSGYDRDSKAMVYVAESNGANLRPVVEGDRPKWSSDGKRLVFVRRGQGTKSSIWTSNADGTNPTKITDVDSGIVNPTWLPDGHSVAFEKELNHIMAIYQINIDGTGLKLLEGNPQISLSFPSFSPDGNLLVTNSIPNGGKTPTILFIDLREKKAWPVTNGSFPNVIWNR